MYNLLLKAKMLIANFHHKPAIANGKKKNSTKT